MRKLIIVTCILQAFVITYGAIKINRAPKEKPGLILKQDVTPAPELVKTYKLSSGD